MTNERDRKLESTILNIMPAEFKDSKIVPKAPKLTRRNTLVLLGSATAAVVLACGAVEATLPDGTGIPTVVPTSGPEKEPQPIKYATWVEIGIYEQAEFTDSLPADRPRFLEGGLSELAGFRLDNGVQDPIVTKFIMYEINPDDSFKIVDAEGNSANQNAVIYIEEYDGYGNIKLKKLYGVSYATIDANTGKTVGTSTIWSEVADSKIDTVNKTVDLTGAKPVLVITSDKSDTKMYFRPLMPKNMLVGLPSNIDEVALPVMFPGSAFKMVDVEATAQPEEAKLPDALDQIYKDQIEKFGYKWKYDKDGNILVNFGNYNSYFEDKTAEDQFVLAFTKTEGGYKTNAFIHNADKISSTQEDKIDLLDRTNSLENFKRTDSGGVVGEAVQIVLSTTGCFIEEIVQTDTGEEVQLIKAVVQGFSQNEKEPKNIQTTTAIFQAKFQDGGFFIPFNIIKLNPDSAWTLNDYMSNIQDGYVFLGYMPLTENSIDKLDPSYAKARTVIKYFTKFVYPYMDQIQTMANTGNFDNSLEVLPLCSIAKVS